MRNRIALLSKSRTLLIGLVAAVTLALVGTTVGYARMSNEVTLSLDGEARQVTSSGDTVGDVLEDQGIEVDSHDLVAPSVDEEISDGSRISVRFGRPLELNVNGKVTTHWVTSTDVQGALAEIGRRFAGADLSASRGASIDRDGMSLTVVTPKTFTIKIGKKKPVKRKIAALTTTDVLDELGVKYDKDDEISPKRDRVLEGGERIEFHTIRVVKKAVNDEAIDHDVIERADDSMLEGKSETVREGRDGLRDVTYRLVYRDGDLYRQKVVRQDVVREAVDTIVRVGTKEEPAVPSGGANFAGGSTVWDQLAQCESGGNWAINTGNGYYGGLQFSLSTWQGYGGAGYPHQQSREYQIMIAERVRAATGGYGSWPHCSQQLGLPQ